MPRIASASLALLLLSAPALARPTPAAEADRIAALASTGEPRRCLRLADVLETRPVGQSMLLVREGANRWYRMTFQEPCKWLNPNRIVSFRTDVGLICTGDLADVVDAVAQIRFPACVLGPFEPISRDALFSR